MSARFSDLVNIRTRLRKLSADMQVAEGVEKNCSGCQGHHIYSFGKYCKFYLSCLVAGDVNDTELESVPPDQEDVEEVIGELKDQIEKEKLRMKEIIEAEQVLQ